MTLTSLRFGLQEASTLCEFKPSFATAKKEIGLLGNFAVQITKPGKAVACCGERNKGRPSNLSFSRSMVFMFFCCAVWVVYLRLANSCFVLSKSVEEFDRRFIDCKIFPAKAQF